MSDDSKPYVSSIVKNYGDTDRVAFDCIVLNEILGRQGSNLLLDIVAEQAGTVANRFRFSPLERKVLIETTVSHLKNALEERL